MVKVSAAIGFLLFAGSLARAQGIDVNSGGGITINTGGRVDVNAGSVTVAGTVDLVGAGSTLGLAVTAGNVTVTSGTVTMSNGAYLYAVNLTINATGALSSAASTGQIQLAGNWSNAGTWTPGLSVVTFNGSGAQTADQSGANATAAFYSLTVNKSAGTFTTYDSDGAGGADAGDRLNVTSVFTLTAGTFDADPDTAQIEHTFAAYTQTSGTLKMDTTGDTSNLYSNITIAGNLTLNGGSFSSADLVSPTYEITVGGNFQGSSFWRFPGWLRMRGPADNAGTDTLTMMVGTAGAGGGVRVLQIWLQDDEDQITIGGSNQMRCEYLTLKRGEVRIGLGKTLSVVNYTHPGFTTADSAAGELGRIRFDGDTAVADRRLVIDGGTVNAYELGEASTGNNDGTFEITAAGGALDLNASPGGFKGGVVFDNLDNGNNTSPSILLRGGTVTVAGSWQLTDSESADTLRFSASAGTIQFDGGAAQSITHSPEAESIVGEGMGMDNVTIANTGDPNSVAVTAATDFGVKVALAINDGRFDLGAGRTVTMTAGGSVTVASAGRLKINGTLTSAGTYSMTVNGEIDGSGYTVTGLNASGIVFGAAATILDLNGGSIDVSNGLGLDLSSLTAGSPRRLPYSLVNMSFVGGGGTNVRATAASPVVAFLGNAASARWGEGFESDPAGRVHWVTGSVERILDDVGTASVTNGSAAVGGAGTAWTFVGGERFRIRGEAGEYIVASSTATTITLTTPYRGVTGAGKAYDVAAATLYDTLAEAVTAAGGRFRMRNRVATSEAFDVETEIPGGGGAVAIENVVWYRLTGSCAQDSDAGAVVRTTLRNCIVARGNVSEADLVNGTVFDMGATTIAVANCGAKNTIFEDTPALVGLNTTNLFNAGSALFVNPNGLDFHLKAAQDGGTDDAYAWDIDGHARTSGTWDIGADEWVGATVTPKVLSADLGGVSRFHFLGSVYRGGAPTASGFAYLTSVGGSGTAANNNTLYAVDLTTMTIVDQTQAVGPIVNVSFWVDNTTQTTSWRAFLFLIVDTNDDGIGDSIQLVVDRFSGAWEFHHPIGDVLPATPVTDRKFGSVTVGARRVWRPGAAVGDYEFRSVTLATVPESVDDTAEEFSSTANKMEDLAMFVVARKVADAKGALFKVCANVYDTTDNGNRLFGGTIWDVKPGDAGYLYNFDHRAPPTFTWASGFQELFVPVSESGAPAPARTVLVRYTMAGIAEDPAASRNWQATEEALPVDENQFGGTLDNGNAGAAITYGTSDGQVIYNRSVVSGSGSQGLWWASRLKDAAGNPTSPVVAPQRFWPNAFAVVGFDGGVNKIWNVEAAKTTLSVAVLAGDPVIDVSSTAGFPASGKIYIEGDEIDYTGTNGTQFTGCTGVLAHPLTGTAVLSAAAKKNGALASTGLKLEPDGDGNPANNEVAEAGTLDPDWPLPCVGKPVSKVWVRGTKLYWGTDRGYVYGWNWNRDGSSIAGGNETMIPGYPYVIPGAKVTWIFVHPNAKVLVGTDTGALYQFEP